MDIRQDPNSIPNFSNGDRLGELQAGEPEQVQSSVELDPQPPGDDPQHDIPVGSGRDSPLDNGSGATSKVKDPSTTAPAGGPGEASQTGPGSVDGRVGAP